MDDSDPKILEEKNPKQHILAEIRKSSNFSIVSSIVEMLEALPVEEQTRIIQVVSTWLHPNQLIDTPVQRLSASSIETAKQKGGEKDYPFAGREEIGVKEFMLEKDPKTDVERLTSLAYYLTHYRNLPYFKTEDLSKLNVEAAQPRFTNAAFTAKNAMRDGFFVPAPKQGLRQLSALGEQYVQALPDHDKTQAIRSRMRPRGSRSRFTPDTQGAKSSPGSVS